MDTVYPATTLVLARGRRRRSEPRAARRRTQPVTFAEIKEVDEEKEAAAVEADAESCGSRRRQVDVVGGQQGACRRHGRPDVTEPGAPAPLTTRSGSEPHDLHRDT